MSRHFRSTSSETYEFHGDVLSKMCEMKRDEESRASPVQVVANANQIQQSLIIH